MNLNRLVSVFTIAAAIVANSFLVAQEKGNASDGPKPVAEKSDSPAPPSGQRLEAPAPRNDAGNFDAVKGQIKATDEEWKVIGPKIRAVMSARRVADAGLNSGAQQNVMFGFAGFQGGGQRGGPGGGGGFGGGRGFGGPGGGGPGGPGGGGPGFGRDAFDAPGNNGGGPGGPGGRGGFGGGRGDGDRGGERRGPDVAENGRRDNPGGDDREARRNDPQDGKGAPRENRNPNNPGDAPAPNGPPGADVAIVRGGPDGGGPGGGPGGGGPGFGGPGGNNFVSRALTELQTAAGDAKSSPEDLREKIAAVRAARTKARDELRVAQQELLQLITPTQEATLIGLGYLD